LHDLKDALSQDVASISSDDVEVALLQSAFVGNPTRPRFQGQHTLKDSRDVDVEMQNDAQEQQPSHGALLGEKDLNVGSLASSPPMSRAHMDTYTKGKREFTGNTGLILKVQKA